MNQQSSKHIAISLDGMPAPALGCFMVDRNLKLLWYRPFVSEAIGPQEHFNQCYNILNKKCRCQPCAALTAFTTGRPASCKQIAVTPDGRKISYHIVASPIKDDKGDISWCVEVIQDVTSQSSHKESYKEISEFNYNILYNAPVGIFTLNKHGIITSTNPAHLEIAGSPDLEKVLGLDWLHCPNVIEAGLDHYLERGLTGESFEVIDLPYTTFLTGKKIYITIRGVPLRNKDKEIEGLLCIIEDTTEKTLYLKEMERLKKYNENIIQSITSGIMVIDNDLKIRTWNNGMTEIFGIPAHEALTLSLKNCLKRMGLTKCMRKVKEGIRCGRTSTFEKISIQNPKRGFISVNYKIIPLTGDNEPPPGVILFFEDITQKEKTEIQYQALFKGAKDGIIVTDPRGYFLSANPKALELLSTTWDKLKEKQLQSLILREDRKQFRANLNLIKKGREIQPYPVRLIVSHNEAIPVEMSVSRILEHKKTVALQFIMRDIRERIRLEKELLQASKLSGLGELAAGVAHEINNPLATIAGYAEEILDLIKEWKGALNKAQLEELEQLTGTIREQSYRCKEITKNLLDFARINASSFQEVDLNEMIHDVLSIAGYSEAFTKHRVKVSLSPELPLIKADYSHIQQVLLNIFKNALDATENHGTITIKTEHADGFVVVSFQDTGIGMTEAELERIFDPFFTTKPPDRGTGLGLSICYRILERLGGKIEVSSKKGSGSEFKIYFPKK